jgi:hypothetical protein
MQARDSIASVAKSTKNPIPKGHPDRTDDRKNPVVPLLSPEFERWAEEKHGPWRSIPAGISPTSGRREIKSGMTDPEMFSRARTSAQDKIDTNTRIGPPSPDEMAPEPTSLKNINKAGNRSTLNPILGTAAAFGALKSGDTEAAQKAAGWSVDSTLSGIAAPALKSAEIVNDVNTRLANARRWRADDPEDWALKDIGEGPYRADEHIDKVDDPTFTYTSPKSGRKFKAAEAQAYYDIGDGKPRVMTPETVTPDKDPRNIENGRYLYYWIDDGNGDKVHVPADAIEERKGKLVHTAFPDGQILMYADGRPGPGMKDPDRVQDNAGLWGMNPVNPRSPTEDTRGKSIEDSIYNVMTGKPWEYDIRKSAIKEAPAYLTDLALGSAPYMIDRRYALLSGASRALPPAMGYDADTYAPMGRDFQRLGTLGQGTYEDKTMTNAQRVGAILSPMVDSWAERASGQAVGGLGNMLPDGSPAKEWFTKSLLGRLLGAGIVEGAEEMVVSPFDQLAAESWANLGRDKTWNPQTNQYDYDQKSPKFATMPTEALGAGVGGALMGLPMQGGKEIGGAVRDNAFGGRFAPVPEAPEIPRMTPDEIRKVDPRWRDKDRKSR